MKLLIACSKDLDAHKNQASELSLMKYAEQDIVLYLWANSHAVFIGRNQNAFVECDVDLLEKEGGTLARRITGGGAVYHDSGNLNYTFILPKHLYNTDKQFSIVQNAINNLGFDVKKSGRNDLTINDRKFSGNAFYVNDKIGLHHGTILINSSSERISRYLLASKLKLKAKGVKSVASRIINLCDVRFVTKEQVADSLVNAFVEDYYGEVSYIEPPLDKEQLDFCTDRERVLGDNITLDLKVEHRFSWGMADIRVKLNGNVIEYARIYSDSLDTDLVEQKEELLKGKNICDVEAVLERL